MGNFFAELKRRHIYRVAATYTVVAWVLIQFVSSIAPMLKLPDWIGPAILVLLLVGFPVALIFAWTLELKSAGPSGPPSTGKADWILAGALATVIALILYQQFASAPGSRTTQASIPSGLLSQSGGISIAVLPFANMSGDAGQEFFSDGMTEEITSALAKIQGLKVIGRTSAFQFKGQSQDLRAIGQALSVGYLIEGSVRKAGDQVRITAQLIKADDGTHLWTENYDRQLTNIFAMQEDIAQAIAGALRLPLGLQQGETLVSNRTRDLEAYQQFLRGKGLMRGLFFEEAMKVLEPVVASDPNFAPAWAYLSVAYALMPTISPAMRNGSVEEIRRLFQSYWPKAEMAAREAIRLDPKLAIGHMALAFTQIQRANYVAGDKIYQQALALDANDPTVLHVYGMLLAATGRLKESLRLREQLRAQEPFVPVFNMVTTVIMRANGDNKAAIPILEASRQAGPLGSPWTNGALAQAYAAEGRFSEAAKTILSIQESNLVERQTIEEVAEVLHKAPGKVSAPKSLPVSDPSLNWIYAYTDAPERMLEWPERRVEIGYIDLEFEVWLPEFAPLRKTERFKALMRKTGIVDYWRAKGWPDLCHPVGAADFVCN